MKYQTVEGETEAIRDVSFSVSEGEFVSVVGPSGCGKSTILNILSGLEKPTAGQVALNGRMGYMLQKDHLFEWRTILKNCLLGPEVQGLDMGQALENVMRLLKTYGLESFMHHYPNQLSGGMRQRAALIRTLAVSPDILLLDEAFSALDYQTRLAVVDEVWTILKKERKTAIIVTHDIAEAISMSDRIIVFSRRPAVIKNIYDIVLAQPGNTPLENRKDEKFRHYFNAIWKELDIHVDRS
ncbi:MAG: ABC transporter ATP-binding protein [Desulfocucumaceae bacterium]